MKNKKLISDTAEIAEPKNGKATTTNGAKARQRQKLALGRLRKICFPMITGQAKMKIS